MAKLTALVLTLLMFVGASATAAPPATRSQVQGEGEMQMRTVTLDVENMTCSMCPITVRKSLEAVTGVKAAQANDETHTATVTYDPALVSPQDLIRATTEAGYPSSVRK